MAENRDLPEFIPPCPVIVARFLTLSAMTNFWGRKILISDSSVSVSVFIFTLAKCFLILSGDKC